MDWNNFGWMLMGAVVSGAVGWVSQWSSSRRIAETHAKLTVLMSALEAERVVTFTYDAKRNPVGVTLEASAMLSATSGMTASATLERVPVDPNPTPAKDQ